MTIANGFCESLPIPVETAAGSMPRQATRAVIIIGRKRAGRVMRGAHRIQPVQTQLIDEGIKNDAGLDRHAHQCHEA